MLRRCNECFWRSWSLKMPVQLSVFIQDEGFRSYDIIQYNYQQNINNELVRMSESASLLALNTDFKIWFGAC